MSKLETDVLAGRQSSVEGSYVGRTKIGLTDDSECCCRVSWG